MTGPSSVHDQNESGRDDNDADGLHGALPGWRETFSGDGGCYDCHRSQIHGSNYQQDHRKIGATQTASSPMGANDSSVEGKRREDESRPPAEAWLSNKQESGAE